MYSVSRIVSAVEAAVRAEQPAERNAGRVGRHAIDLGQRVGDACRTFSAKGRRTGSFGGLSQ